MALIKYEPMSLLNRMQNDLNEFFHRERGWPAFADDDFRLLNAQWTPRIDVDEEEDHFLITADVPGVAPKDIQVSMEGNELRISGERKQEQEERKKHHHRKECMTGYFERRFVLPDVADSANISAEGKHGVLTIRIPKKPASKPKTIEIKSAD